MKLARFSVDSWESYGVVEGARVRVIQGDIFGEHKFTQASYPLDRVKLLPPTQPRAFWAIGLNYAAHIAHQEQALGADHPDLINTIENYAIVLRVLRRHEEAAQLEDRAGKLRAEL